MVMNANNSKALSHDSNDEDKSFQQYDLDGLDFKIVLSGNKTGGKYSLLEILFSAEKENEIPLHLHSRETLIIYILEGNFSFRYGNEKIVGNQGTVLKFEKDIPHSYKKTGKTPGRLLILFIPAGFENFFKDVRLNQSKMKLSGEEDPVLLHVLEKKYGGKFVFG
ncbi:cupin-domain containing protein [Candidatus Nitrosocosmicus arcticus]|uniref:Cupin-domain containing protein n=2 Tax=Candidatus Nitrosocosmicus arcticus TaxID=2035267 RepID=A0A557STM7_9ARCH|nr:cupin-domain containing protein [Candidatus Nitrosocosmicus arcticus]